MVVPADEIQRIPDVITGDETAAGIPPVVLPGVVGGLGVSVGAGGTGPGDHPEQLVPVRPGAGSVTRFLVDEGHAHRNRHAPALLGSPGMLIPASFLFEDGAEVVGAARRLAGAGMEKSQQNGAQKGDQARIQQASGLNRAVHGFPPAPPSTPPRPSPARPASPHGQACCPHPGRPPPGWSSARRSRPLSPPAP